MNLRAAIRAWWAPRVSPPTNEQIIQCITPQVLALAVGVENGSAYGAFGGDPAERSLAFESWFRVSKKRWIPHVMQACPATEFQVHDALREYVEKNKTRLMNEILEEERGRRNYPPRPERKLDGY